jgi:hypothetical protein
MPRSPLATRPWEIRSPAGSRREEARLDQAPARGKIRIARGHCPDRVEVIVQHDHRLDREGMVPTRLSKRGPQFVDVFGQQRQPPFRQIDGEEEAPRR